MKRTSYTIRECIGICCIGVNYSESDRNLRISWLFFIYSNSKLARNLWNFVVCIMYIYSKNRRGHVPRGCRTILSTQKMMALILYLSPLHITDRTHYVAVSRAIADLNRTRMISSYMHKSRDTITTRKKMGQTVQFGHITSHQ